MTRDPLVCLVCGHTSTHVRPRLAAFTVPVEGREFDFVPRCDNTEACFGRVMAQGEEWPLRVPLGPVAALGGLREAIEG
jgi:hypothetical protein